MTSMISMISIVAIRDMPIPTNPICILDPHQGIVTILAGQDSETTITKIKKTTTATGI